MTQSVEDFMAMLAQQTAPMQKKDFRPKAKTIEKISLAFNGNWGRYQIFPFNSVVTDFPFVTLMGTREVCVPRKSILEDGTEQISSLWIKLLPNDGYCMKDQSGRRTSSLTAEDERVLNEARQLFDSLWEELDVRNNIDYSRSLIRKRNYTIFHAYCLNKWNFEDSRTPNRQNFPALFVCTAKGFVPAVENSIRETTILNGGDYEWIKDVYTTDMTRRGFMMFSISHQQGQPGFQININHKSGIAPTQINLNEEELEVMKDPVATFLGWQANREEGVAAENRRLFNPTLAKEAANFLAQQLAAVRAAKAAGEDVMEAIQKTTALAAETAPTWGSGNKTNDPILKSEQENNVDVQRIAENNTKPYSTPPAGHFSPISGAPVGNSPQQPTPQQPAPFAPNFGNTGFGGGAQGSNNNGGFPF